MRKRILFFTDGHADNINPVSRRDDYMVACVAELNEALEIARDRNCDAFIHGGDVFHRMEVNGECRNQILACFLHDSYDNPWPFERYVVGGNHDYRHNPQNLRRSALGTIIKAQAVKYVTEIPSLKISCIHYYDGLEYDIADGALKANDSIIWICHANITLGEYYEKADYVQFGDIPVNPQCQLILAGHIHSPMEMMRDDGVWFVNPGSISRNAATVDNMNRRPQVVLVEYELDGSYLRHEYIELQTPLPSKDIFKLEEIQARKDKQYDTQRFIQQISQITMWTADSDKYESLRKSGQAKQVDASVLERAIQTLKDVNEKRMALL